MTHIDNGDKPRLWNPRARMVLVALILLGGLALRLRYANEPPTDYHCWRQTQTLMVAKSFHATDMNLFQPRVYWRNTVDNPVEAEGIVGGTELQVTPWLTAMLYQVAGEHYWVDRVVPIFFSLAGLVFFFLFVEFMLGTTAAAAASVLLCVSPMYLFLGRVQMPESFALAASFATLFYFSRWLSQGGWAAFTLALTATVFMLLGKPTLALMALPMLFLVLLQRGKHFYQDWRLYSFAAISGTIFLAYMWYSFLVLTNISGLAFYAPGLVNRDILLSYEFYQQMADSIWNRAVGWPLLLLALPALLIPLRWKDLLPHAWLAGVLVFFAYAAHGNFRNDYYQLILAPVAAYLVGQGIHKVEPHKYLRVICLVLVAAAAPLSVSLAEPFYHDPVGRNFKRAGDWIRENTPPDTLVLCSNPNPATLYFASRIGWTCWYEKQGNIKFSGDTIAMARQRGASVLVIPDGDKLDDTYFPHYRSTRDYLYENYYCARGDNFAVFFMDEPADLSTPEDGRIVFGTRDSRKYLRGRWGRDYTAKGSSETYADMRYNKTGALRVDLPEGVQALALKVSSPLQTNEISVSLDAVPLGSIYLQGAWAQHETILAIPPDARHAGRRTIELHVAGLKDELVGILLWQLRIIK